MGKVVVEDMEDSKGQGQGEVDTGQVKEVDSGQVKEDETVEQPIQGHSVPTVWEDRSCC